MATNKVKLNQIIAVEKGAKERTDANVTKLYHQLQKPEPMQGLARTYQPIAEEGELSEKIPAQNQYVQVNVLDVLAGIQTEYENYLDIMLTQEAGNALAKADVVVDGNVLFKDAPVAFLLRLEKVLVNVRTVLAKAPTYDLTERWNWSDANRWWESTPVSSARTKKIEDFVVIQGSGVPEKGVAPKVEKVTRDLIAGYWTQTKQSATLSPERLRELQGRVQKLIDAVKFAREEANSMDVDQKKVGSIVMGYLFS